MKNRLKTTIARTAVLLLLMLTIVVPDLTAGSQVSVSVSDNLAAIGDRINLKIIVKTTSQVDRIKLKSAENVFEVVDQLDTQKRQEEHYTVFEKNITIAFFKTGDFNVGPFEVELLKDEKTLEIRETNSIPVTIKSVLKEEDKDIKPLKSLIELEGDPFYILKYVILAVLIVAAVLFFIYWIRKRRQGGPRIEAPLLSPLEELQQRVRQLESDSLLRKGEVKLHFLHLTEILKHFLSRTYRFNAEELTTYETIYDLKKHETETPVVNHMDSLFSTSDLVKFAKYIPEAETLQDVSERLDELIGIYTRRMLHVEKNEAGNAPTDTGGGLATKPDTTMLPPTTVPEEREASL